MEKEKLLERWRVLLNEPSSVKNIRNVLQERCVILHRLNELGEKDIEGLSIVEVLEETNDSMREINRVNTA
jgi:hypothetical protein